ncbi:hypothetical protein IHE50_01735 [Candidatus Parvarchaeota archaeon]|uniref:Uncharacterized protein n=1 Tax=Candidatus Acidifodinimicrobium mancum TaxID=2898728 RepID=A0A8T3V130_9ARCH|nr:hypothetical protein [Candidatus Acidifodinimicrobium mancum]
MILTLQGIVLLSTVVITILSAVLAFFLTLKYIKLKSKNYLFWSLGLWLFTVGVVLEVLFAFGLYSEVMIDSYLTIVALLVEALALGSVQFLGKTVKKIYYIYAVITTIVIIASFLFVRVGDVIANYVVFGLLPILTTVVSSIITFPAAAIIIVSAYLTIRLSRAYTDKNVRRHKNLQMSSIIAGVVVVSIAGTLYIAAYPELLYWSEFFGILLLWLGFI